MTMLVFLPLTFKLVSVLSVMRYLWCYGVVIDEIKYCVMVLLLMW